MWLWFLCVAAAAVYSAEGAGAGAARLVCYVEGTRSFDFNECTHLIYAGDARGEKLETLLKEYRKNNPRLKIILRITDSDKDIPALLKSKNVQGLEVYEAHRSFNKTKVSETVDAAKMALSSYGGGPLYLALPAHPELLAKYYDLRTLVKKTDLFMVHTHALGMVKKMTYHPSRLSGLWDMMNTDSVVDLVVGLGVPVSKVVISLPATARQFSLQNETLSTPGSPTDEEEPKEIDQSELCRMLRNGRWTLERDQDLSAPYAFKDKTWISFEDSSSVDVKGKYARVRGLAGLALYDADRDQETPCGLTLKAALAKVLNQQSRAPRAAVLRSLQNEILSAPSKRALDALQVSPYRITQVVDADGVIHSMREDTRTEFTCSRQGYFVHPRSCARFYRCVKFDQLSADYTVFEFDCPAGLAFDSRYEVCVWPGSLPDSQACPGSSEIAPVPRTRFICPNVEGYYVDPENCRWFFACLDHGKSPLTAYEFRCPFGLGFDPARLTCDWPWLVPACAGIGRYEAEAFGFSGAALGGAAGFQGKTADSVNIAAHQSLVSGAALNNLVGIQSNILTSDTSNRDGLDEFDINGRFSDLSEARQGESSGVSYNIVPAEGINQGLLRAFDDGKGEYTSGSLILDDFRFSDKDNVEFASASDAVQFNSGKYDASTSGRYQNNNAGKYVATDAGKYRGGSSGQYRADSAGKYVPSDSGQYRASASGKYINDAGKYRAGDAGFYTASSTGRYVANDAGKYRPSNAGFYTPSPAGKYVASDAGRYVASDSGKYRPSTAGFYTASSTGKYVPSDAGKYRPSDSGQYVAGDSGKYKGLDAYPGVSPKYDLRYQSGAYYKKDDRGKYIHNTIGDRALPYEHVTVSALPYEHTDKPYISTTDAYDTAHGGYDYPKPSIAFEDGPANTNFNDSGDTVNIGYVGKTSLVDVEPSAHKKQSNVVIEPDVTISHVGSSYQDGNEYSLVTNPISSTTASPISVTTTFKSLYVPQPPKTSFKQIFTYNQPAVTVVQPAEVAFKQFTPAVEGPRLFTENYNSGKTSEYEYSVPNIKLDIGISYTTPAPFVTVTKQIPTGFGYNEQTVQVNNGGYEYSTPRPVTEEPFKKVVAYTTGPSVAEYLEPNTYQQNSYSQTTVSSTARPISVTPSTIYENPFLKYTQSNKQQTQYREDTGLNTGNYGYTTGIKSEQPQTIIYSTPQPIISIQTTVQPQIFSEQRFHTVDAGRVNTYHDSSISGYEYSKPVNKFETVISTSAPYRSFSQKIQEKSYIQPIVTSTPQPRVDITYEQPSISIYENPFLKYTQKYSDASLVSRQEFRQSHTNTDSGYQNGKTAVFVSTTPSTLVYEDHYNDYESPQKSIKYQSIEVKPQIQYQQFTNIQKSFPTTNVINNYNRVEEQAPEIQTAYKGEDYLPPVLTGTTPIQVSTSTKAPEYLPPLEDTYIPSTTARPRVKTVEYFPPTQSTVQITASPRTPEYLPPKVSEPIVTSTKAPEYLPPRVPVAIFTSTNAPEYLPPLDNTYLPPSTAKPKLNNLEYLSPVKQTLSTYDYTGELPKTEGVVVSTSAPAYSTRKQNIVVETAKSNVLGFETVGTNAGLVSTTYSSPRPSLSTTVDYLPPETVTSTYSRVTKPINVRPTVTSARPTVYYEPSTARVFKGPEYLVPLEESNQQNIQTYEYSTVSPKIKYNPFSEISVSTVPTRKQNIVIESAKSQFAESDAGIITDAIEVTSSKPLRRTRPKVAVVTKLNDFNPLLVRKLGAVCSCQSPILVLRGRKPSIQTEELDLEDVEQKSTNVLQNSFINTITTPAPLVSTSFNPIIVPDDSFYEDYQDSNINVEIASAYNAVSERVQSSTPIISSTEKIVKIRPRVNAVTIAPTYQTVLLEKSSSASPLVGDSETVVIDSKSFNRYGPGGWRGKDETLQGSVDCQRAGLFRHPKHCNKFYSCRWDCKKERFTLHVFNCPIQLSFDSNIGACNWPSQGPACQGDTLLINTL